MEYNCMKPMKDPNRQKPDYYGIIAQELAELFPEMIENEEGNDYMLLNQERLKYISYHILQDLIVENGKLSSQLDSQATTIQQQATKNTELENKVTTLESTLETVLARLTALENTPTE